MLYLARWKVILVLLLCAAGALFSTPNFLARETAAALPAWLPHKQVNLGLDLQGGSHLLLEVDVDAAVRERLEDVAEEIRGALRGRGIGFRDLGVEGGAAVLEVRETDSRERALEAIRDLSRSLSAAPIAGLGRELEVASEDRGRILVRLSEGAVRERVRGAIEQSIEIVRRRIDEVGTREPIIQRQGQDRILVQLPGEQDPVRIKRLLGETAKISFRLVHPSAKADRGPPPDGFEVVEADPRSGERTPRWVVQKRAVVGGGALVDSQAAFERGQPVVSFRLDPLGARRLAEATRENVGRPFAIVLDDKVVSAPVVREPILGGAGVISGRFTVQEANDLALLLRAGALPARLDVVEERTVGPALGADSIRAGSIASAIGLLLVVAFMAVAYGLFGLISALGLAVNMVLICGALSLLQATLTLPGIAGIVLTIGMAVDGNVLIFERIREEARVGRPAIAAMEAGFVRASATILDSNVTTLIAAILLFLLGSGPVKGFAVTLAIGVLTSVFTAVVFVRIVLAAWLKRARPAALPL